MKGNLIICSAGSCGSTYLYNHLKKENQESNKFSQVLHTHAWPNKGLSLGYPEVNPFFGKNNNHCASGYSDGFFSVNKALIPQPTILFILNNPLIIFQPRNNLHHFLNMHCHNIQYVESFLGLSFEDISRNIIKNEKGHRLPSNSLREVYIKASRKSINNSSEDPLKLKDFTDSWYKKESTDYKLILVKYKHLPTYWNEISKLIEFPDLKINFKPSKRIAGSDKNGKVIQTKLDEVNTLFKYFSMDDYPDFKVIDPSQK
jgi:hypothetical protein